MTRVRFAPSPTGALHIGGIRTALYNYLLARQRGGTFILRIEDTDQTRYVPGAEDYIIRALDWLGMVPDEGPVQGGPYAPYRQSERMEIYADYARQLVDLGKAYIAFDTPEELEAMRQRLQEKGVPTPKYDASVRMEMVNSLTLSAEEVKSRIDSGMPYTIRLLVEPGDIITIHDLIRGEVQYDSTELDDKILLKADGYPTYHLANVVDDHLMAITDVIRGEEWLPSTAHHVLLYRAFGWEDTMPSFSHLPLILKPDGKGKLSKRDGQKFGFPVFPLGWDSPNLEEAITGFDTAGFEPVAVINFLAFLGWNPGTEQEIFTVEELIREFDPAKIHKAGARFDFDKALWFNEQHVQRLSFEDAEERLKVACTKAGFDEKSTDLKAVFELMKPRVQVLRDIVVKSRYFFSDDLLFVKDEITGKWRPEAEQVLNDIGIALDGLSAFTAEACAEATKAVIANSGVKMGVVMPVLRAALTGSIQGPDVYTIIAILGKDKAVTRIRQFISNRVWEVG